MPVIYSPPARKTRSQARAQAVFTQTRRAPLDSTPAVTQLRAQFGRNSTKKSNFFLRSSWPFSSTLKGPGEDGKEEEENSVEEEMSDGTEGVPAPVWKSQGTGGPTLAQSNQPVSHQSEPSLLTIIQPMTQIMSNLQEASSSEASRPPAFKISSMKAEECFDETQPFKVKSFIQSCQFIFHNDPANFSQDRKKVLFFT
ncbi:hypothetical protein O181_044701 [Austropuccinia psidii MF-1]|uniref:Uncharacterized protein n=1 Tax=Austropuccinia psidii MF-1 TaxID=1389203 RepID=A0A9Q3HH38_9BASI|nr:hypothetical protein [Austropuccinia psidii MF-1]